MITKQITCFFIRFNIIYILIKSTNFQEKSSKNNIIKYPVLILLQFVFLMCEGSYKRTEKNNIVTRAGEEFTKRIFPPNEKAAA